MKKILIGVVGLIVILLCVGGVSWKVNYDSYYKLTAKNYKKVNSQIYYKKDDKTKDELEVSFPHFPSYTGNIIINNPTNTVSFLYWPGFNQGKGDEFGATIYNPDDKKTWLIQLNKNSNILEKSKNQFTDKQLIVIDKLMKENILEIKRLKAEAVKEWHLPK